MIRNNLAHPCKFAVPIIQTHQQEETHMKRAIFFTAIVGFLVGIALVGFPKTGSVLKSKGFGSGNSARTIFVKNANGSGGNEDGSMARPYSTVSQGYSAAMPGDTLVIAAGYYPESITFDKPITIRSECGPVSIGAMGDYGPRDFVLPESVVPVVNAGALLDGWNDATTNSFGVAGEDPFGKTIFQHKAKDLWLPVGPEKRTLCGTLSDFYFYDDRGDGADWCNDIIPFSPRYDHLLEDAKGIPGVDLKRWLRCGSNNAPCKEAKGSVPNCVEVEITPDETLSGFDWFNSNTGKSPLEGKCLCVYGPWVVDFDHGVRPEIHPSELLWWKDPAKFSCGEPSSTLDGTFLMLVQDDSNRYDRVADYDTQGTPNFCWRPWSAYPRTGKFKLAFRVNTLATSPQNLSFAIDKNRNVNINPHDATDGAEHTLVYKGRPLLTVRETGEDGFVQVGFENLFRRTEAEGEVLYGFVTLTSSVGINDRGGEGYILIHVSQ